jgi:hypothetical protein
MTDATEALREVARQRGQLADRMSMPRWYLVLYGAGYAGVGTGPVLNSTYSSGGLFFFPLTLLGGLVLVSPPFVLPRLRQIGNPDLKQMRFPSLRPNQVRVAAALFAPLLLSLGLFFLADRAVAAALCATAIGAVLAPLALARLHRGIAEDIRTGAARPKTDRTDRKDPAA